ncbi:restriction endonuclease subunit S [Vibrio alginolyticus]|jgi:type I restriction enzyme S subunit|uniref:restriction endonuclease subunit S n=1 Tax=Vibrio alginolyticus TaxID=663 RepID=UPI001BD64798|nr:restriction endonuclease subunit S [Vibrio alginolyticus]MBS9866701.1 restriction endonuclease subunit S [Vibrio alginolyticus]MBS9889735.1 restriction endonuclease subunit S [Vibrio alginolyticus]
MTGRYKAYSEYKESGIDWIGVIPVSWSCLPIKRSFEVVNGSTPRSGEKLYWDGDITWVTPADLSKVNESISTSSKTITNEGLSSCGTSLVPKGSLILSTRAPIGTIAIASKELCTNQGCKSLIKTTSVENKYVYYVLSISGKQLNNLGRGTTFLELSTDELANYRVPNPSIQEQQKIANFLDHETAKIDTLIAKQEKLIELLKEKRQAVISHAVTKGLNPDVPMKDSGVEWLGDVPEHWSVGRLKNVLKIRNGKDYKHVEVALGGYPVYGSGGIFRRSSEYLFDGESVLFGRKGTIDKPLVVKGKFWTVDTMFYSELNKDIDAQYVHSQAILFPFDLLSTNTALPSMTQEDLLELGFVIPPYEEQLAISEAISNHNVNFSNIIEKATKQIELMKERKVALISAAVTGKIDVRDWQELTYQGSA